MSESDSEFSVYQPVLKMPPDLSQPVLDPSAIRWRNGMLVRATNWLGDTLMTLPAVYKLRQFIPYPCGLFILCPAKLAPIWQAAPWVSHAIPLGGHRVGSEAASAIRGIQPGVAVVLPNSFGSALDVYRKGIPVRVGRSGRGRGWMLTTRLPQWVREADTPGYHQLSHYLEIAAAFGKVTWDAAYPKLSVAGAAGTVTDVRP